MPDVKLYHGSASIEPWKVGVVRSKVSTRPSLPEHKVKVGGEESAPPAHHAQQLYESRKVLLRTLRRPTLQAMT